MMEMMTVLSMRQKELSYQHLLRAHRPSRRNSVSGGTSPFYGGFPMAMPPPPPPMPLMPMRAMAPLPPGFASGAVASSPFEMRGGRAQRAASKAAATRGCISPLSVGQLPYPMAAGLPTYDQFGYTWHWIVEICAHFALQRQTAHYANQYAQVLLRQRLAAREEDCDMGLMGHYEDILTVQKELQLLGGSCVFIAAKIEEVHPPKASEMAAYIVDHGASGLKCTTEDLVQNEAEYASELQWNLHPVTPVSWLLFLLSGESSDHPLTTMGDFVNPMRNLSGAKDLFVHAIHVIDTALLDAQAVDFLPSTLAGSALLLADASLDLMFVAQFLQLDPNILWDCKNWLFTLVNGTYESVETPGSQDQSRWNKVPEEELLFLQAQVSVPSHLAYGLLRPEVTTYTYPMHAKAGNNQMDHCNNNQGPVMYAPLPAYASPSSSDNYGCFCKDSYHTCGVPPGPVYHYKFGWQGMDVSGSNGLPYDPAAAMTSGPQGMHYR